MMQACNAGNKACFTSTISIGKYVKKCEHTSYLSIQLVPTIIETASAPVFISQEHAAGMSCLLCGPITYTIGFHTESRTQTFMMLQLPQQVYSAITKYSIIIGLIVIAESDDPCL